MIKLLIKLSSVVIYNNVSIKWPVTWNSLKARRNQSPLGGKDFSISAAKQKKENELIKTLNSASKQWAENQELYVNVQNILISYIFKVETTKTRLKSDSVNIKYNIHHIHTFIMFLRLKLRHLLGKSNILKLAVGYITRFR